MQQSGLLSEASGTGLRMPVAVRAVALAQLSRTEDVSEVRLEFARHLLHRAGEMRLLLAWSGAGTRVALVRGRRPVASDGLQHLCRATSLVHGAPAAVGLVALLGYPRASARLAAPGWITRSSAPPRQDPDGLERELLFASGLLELLSGNQAAAQLRLTGASQPGWPRAQERWQRAALGSLGIYRVLKRGARERDRTLRALSRFIERQAKSGARALLVVAQHDPDGAQQRAHSADPMG